MSAVALRDALADPRRTPTTRRVQQALLAASRQAWDISAGADRKMPGATGTALDGGPADQVAGWYLRRVQERAPGDPVVGERLPRRSDPLGPRQRPVRPAGGPGRPLRSDRTDTDRAAGDTGGAAGGTGGARIAGGVRSIGGGQAALKLLSGYVFGVGQKDPQVP